MSELSDGTPFEVSVEFFSDWITGTGTGRYGATDRQVQRDADGLPTLRAKALVGMLRDAAETVVRGLDGDTPGRWQRWLVCVFGSQPAVERDGATEAPRPSSLVARPLRLPDNLRKRILADASADLLTAATVVLRAGVRIDRRTGVAADDTLRVEERARAGLMVTAGWTLTIPGGQTGRPVPWEAEFLLRAAAKLVTAVGGKRRRGAGRCRVIIGGDDGTRLNELLDKLDQAGDPPSAEVNTASPQLGAVATTPVVPRYELRITACGPVVISRGVRGNVVLTERFIPGTALLPLVARALGADATRLITSGSVVITDATVELDGRRAAPTPRPFAVARNNPDGVVINRMHAPPAGVAPAKVATPPAFCVVAPPVDGAEAWFGEPEMVEQAHAVIEDVRQRPTEDSGGLFINQALAAGTVLRAQLWAPSDINIDVNELTGDRSIGRSRKDDYGHIRVEVVPSTADPITELPAPGVNRLTLWLQSDLVLRDDRGHFDPSAERLAVVLGKELGVELTVCGEPWVAVRRWESWQARWGLPRPSLVALRAGSVIQFDINGELNPDAWTRVQCTGLGERRAEGFGRVALQAALLDHREISQATEVRDLAATAPAPALPELDETNSAVLAQLTCHAWRGELRQRVVASAAGDRRTGLVAPEATATQLSTLRTLANRIAQDGGTDHIAQWIKAEGKRLDRRSQWSGVLATLEKLVDKNHPKALYEWLGAEPPPQVARQLWPEVLGWALAEVARIQTRRSRSTKPDGDVK